jgi:hypothetical protein
MPWLENSVKRHQCREDLERSIASGWTQDPAMHGLFQATSFALVRMDVFIAHGQTRPFLPHLAYCDVTQQRRWITCFFLLGRGRRFLKHRREHDVACLFFDAFSPSCLPSSLRGRVKNERKNESGQSRVTSLLSTISFHFFFPSSFFFQTKSNKTNPNNQTTPTFAMETVK